MLLIVVSGPSGSGKTTLAKKILKKLGSAIILNTDNYYKTGINSMILSKIIPSYFDRIISFDYKRFKKHLDFLLKNHYSKYSYKYDFKTKSTSKKYKETRGIRFIIIEGIFGKEILKKPLEEEVFLIKLKTSKKICMLRAVRRDSAKRGKNEKIAMRDFLNAWELFHKKTNNKKEAIEYKKITIRNKPDHKLIIKKIISLSNSYY